MSICTAGHDTTSATLAGTLQQVGLHPEVLKRVKADPTLIPALINEGLRFVAPVKHFMRRATQDYELGGQQIKKGDRVMPLFQSACRDEDLFKDPDTFDIDRNPEQPHGFRLRCAHLRRPAPGQAGTQDDVRTAPPPTGVDRDTWRRQGDDTNFVGGLKHLPAKVTVS